MKTFELSYKNFGIVYEKGYGCDKRTGWRVIINYIYYVEFEKNILVALWKTYKIYKKIK